MATRQVFRIENTMNDEELKQLRDEIATVCKLYKENDSLKEEKKLKLSFYELRSKLQKNCKHQMTIIYNNGTFDSDWQKSLEERACLFCALPESGVFNELSFPIADLSKTSVKKLFVFHDYQNPIIFLEIYNSSLEEFQKTIDENKIKFLFEDSRIETSWGYISGIQFIESVNWAFRRAFPNVILQKIQMCYFKHKAYNALSKNFKLENNDVFSIYLLAYIELKFFQDKI